MIAKNKRKTKGPKEDPRMPNWFKKYFDAKYSEEYIEAKGGINKYR